MSWVQLLVQYLSAAASFLSFLYFYLNRIVKELSECNADM